WPSERVIRLRMLILHGPNAVFVLKNAVIGARFHAAVATRGTARAGPRIFAGVRGRMCGTRWIQPGKTNRAKPKHGASQRHTSGLRPDCHSCARIEPALFARAVERACVRIFILPVRIEVNQSKE